MTHFSSDRFRGFQHGMGRTAEELAAALGDAPEIVHAWGYGWAAVPAERVSAVAAALEVESADLAPTGQGGWWDYTSAVALCAGPRPQDVLRALARLLPGAGAPRTAAA